MEQPSEAGYLEKLTIATVPELKGNATAPAHMQTSAEAEAKGPPEPKNSLSNQAEAQPWFAGIWPA